MTRTLSGHRNIVNHSIFAYFKQAYSFSILQETKKVGFNKSAISILSQLNRQFASRLWIVARLIFSSLSRETQFLQTIV